MEITPQLSTFSVLLIGFVVGLRHALDADHLAAVSAIVSDRKSIWSSSIVGGWWGLGHTITLFAAGLIVIVLKTIHIETIQRYELYMEGAVGVMLLVLGLNVLRKLFTAETLHAHEHVHVGHKHTHLHVHQPDEQPAAHHSFSPRSVIVGMIHGLAGSAGLMLLIVPTISSPTLAMAFILIFGVGSIGGMVAMSFLMGLPLHFTASRFEFLNRGIRLAAGLFSFGMGAILIYEKVISA